MRNYSPSPPPPARPRPTQLRRRGPVHDPHAPIPVPFAQELAVDTEMCVALNSAALPGSTAAMGSSSLSSLLGALTANLTPERTARMAARQAFVELKRAFMDAAALIPGDSGDKLRVRIRHANEPIELWHLRGLVLAMLPSDRDERAAFAQRRVKAQMHNVFADTTIGQTREF